MRLVLIILTVAISTAIIVSGVFVVKNEKGKSKQSDERLKEMQASMQKMETKLEEVNKEDVEKIEVENTSKKNEEAVVEKIVVQKQLEKEVQIEKSVSCVLLDGSVEEISELECEVLKNKDAIRKEINDDYADCMEEVNEELQANLDEGFDVRDMDIANRGNERCKKNRDNKLYKVQ